ncbi:hypothetical protein COV13_04525 [Candidatus Woesearchaeota archaeon CG10_big_fil_rev_8_21_14_0_10_32_9]|nr:MAG: hypothetical protein COV13_04525 [Candidatus Woesearchaeota archaeon CG10_big_fil_rev_8_21_14_0_10_32_9]
MQDAFIEYIALSLIIIGLIIGFFFVLDTSSADAFFVSSDDDAFIDGSVLTAGYSENKDWSYFEIYSCRTFSAGMSGKVNLIEGDFVQIRGSYSDGFFFVDELEMK